MSGKIAVLPETLTDRIAAGEVVERPASIVKELLENALDAGATEIAVDLERGGCQAIRVTDNGEGIESKQVPLAFTRYATSKIQAFEDLYRIRSFGFRGEALPSIASIARVEMVTRRVSSPAGTRIIIEGGEVKELADAGCPVGTSIFVDRIFASVPVRLKFLKSDSTEQGYCLDAVNRLVLAQPGVKMTVSAGKRSLLSVPAARDLAERIGLSLGREIQSQLLPVSGERDGANLKGFVSRPGFTRSNASQIYIFINGRFVKDYLLNHAVMTAYRRLIEARRYPVAVLYLEVPSGDLDVNVHPAKMEVRFRNPREIYSLTADTLGAAIGAGGAPDRDGASAAFPVATGTRPPASGIEEALKRYRVSSGQEKLFFGGAAPPKIQTAVAMPSMPSSTVSRGPVWESAQAARPRSLSDLSYLGQVAGTYLVFAGDEGLVLVDQHAAHERVLFEKLKKQSGDSGLRSVGQRLLLPEVVSLSPRDFAFLTEAAPILEEAGMEVEPFGGDSIIVKALPAFFPQGEAKELIRDLLSDCGEADRDLPLTDKREKIFTALACRGAVKANRSLTGPEVAALCRDLDALPHALTCPHGRPFAIRVPVFDLEKMFKRR